MFEVLPISNVGITARVPESDHWSLTDRQLPDARRLVLYETATRIHLGYVDETEQWRRLNGALETDHVMSWMVAPGRGAAASND
jgi:hypothetical protein